MLKNPETEQVVDGEEKSSGGGLRNLADRSLFALITRAPIDPSAAASAGIELAVRSKNRRLTDERIQKLAELTENGFSPKEIWQLARSIQLGEVSFDDAIAGFESKQNNHLSKRKNNKNK